MNKLRFRALTKDDIETTYNWHNREDIRNLYLSHPFPVNKEMEEQWYNKILYSNFPTTVFGVELCSTDALMGLAILKNIDMVHRQAEFATYIGNVEHRGKGYSKEITQKALDFAFIQLGLNRVYLKVMEANPVAINLYLKVGFNQEGVLRQSVFKQGEFHNLILMSILSDEYKKNNDL